MLQPRLDPAENAFPSTADGTEKTPESNPEKGPLLPHPLQVIVVDVEKSDAFPMPDQV
jgi:hypothetical protein